MFSCGEKTAEKKRDKGKLFPPAAGRQAKPAVFGIFGDTTTFKNGTTLRRVLLYWYKAFTTL